MIQNPQTELQERFFTSDQLAQLDRAHIPRHVAIIPDGNRRWARKQNSPTNVGHREGCNILIDIVKAAKELGVKVITFYLFSTENWTRPEDEVAALMWLLQSFLIEQRETMIKDGIRIHTIGELSRLPENVVETVKESIEATEGCSNIDMVMALNYGSRDEIRRAVNKIVEDCEKQRIKKSDITEELISTYLDTAPFGDPDLLIRTSGEMRISNYLLWQISYSEVYVTEILWPDFQPHHLLEALLNFQKRERRLGGA